MMKVRYRTSTNAWPGFVDLFSNLVIILIFLLIVFVFLWTTTSVFNKASGVKTVADLRQANILLRVDFLEEMLEESDEGLTFPFGSSPEMAHTTDGNIVWLSSASTCDLSVAKELFENLW